MKFSLKIRSSRPTPVTASSFEVVSSYTLDYHYVQSYELADGDFRKVQPAGSVLAFNPESRKVTPHFSSYGFAAVGVLSADADCGDPDDSHDQCVDMIWRGIVLEKRCWDESYGSVLSVAKEALRERITFVKRESKGARSYRHGGRRNR